MPGALNLDVDLTHDIVLTKGLVDGDVKDFQLHPGSV